MRRRWAKAPGQRKKAYSDKQSKEGPDPSFYGSRRSKSLRRKERSVDAKEFERILTLSDLTEKPGEREVFLRSMEPLYEMMERVRKAADLLDREEEESPETGTLPLREDVPEAFPEAESLISLSGRRDGSFYSVPRSI